MIKRSTAYVYVMIASFVLLVHAVVPHHHHENEVFISNHGCKTENGVHNHGTSEHNHNNHDESNSEYCVIEQVVAVRSNLVRHELVCKDLGGKKSNSKEFRAFLFKKCLKVPFSISLSTTQLFLPFSNYSIFASTGLGLRAPPPFV
ncbi:MAG: hypothetical protein B6I20_13250 [Bacteroidetes bacterium 4572_117]|nr:MAG: hypothetical protein B6I20_13250 [Bacteroidetes bacterium 4572_117]